MKIIDMSKILAIILILLVLTIVNPYEVIKSSVEDLIPILSESEENIEYVEASPHDSELISLDAAEIVIPEVEEIEDDNLREKLLNVHLLIANIEALKDNPSQSSELLTKSSSTFLNSFLEETNTFHNSFLEFKDFYFDLGEISSGSTTTHSDIYLPDYEAFYFDDDHIKEISSGISINHFYSFKPGLSHRHGAFKKFNTHRSHLNEWPVIINGKNTPILDVLRIRENLSTTLVTLPIDDDHSPLLTYVVWIFVAYLTYPIIPPYLHPFRNEDT
nr:hypothetical protein [Tanacetum cinerariifolium]